MSVYYTDPADERRKEIRQVLAGTRKGAAFDVSLAKATELLTLFPEAGRDVYILAIVSQRRGE